VKTFDVGEHQRSPQRTLHADFEVLPYVLCKSGTPTVLKQSELSCSDPTNWDDLCTYFQAIQVVSP
jgi:hypothetical protein